MRFELTTLRICNPLHLTTLPPHHKLGIPPGTRTPTNGFGDRYAAITPARQYSNYTINSIGCQLDIEIFELKPGHLCFGIKVQVYLILVVIPVLPFITEHI